MFLTALWDKEEVELCIVSPELQTDKYRSMLSGALGGTAVVLTPFPFDLKRPFHH